MTGTSCRGGCARWSRLLLTAVAIGLGFYFFSKGVTDGFGLFCIVGAFITLGHLVGEMRSWERVRLPLGLVLLAAVIVAVVGGIWLGATNPTGLYVALAALLVGPVALTLVSAEVLRNGEVRPISNFLVGAGALAAGAVWLSQSGVGRYFTVIAVIVLLVLLLAISSDTQTDVVLVATLVALVWSAYPRVVPLDDDLAAAGTSLADQSVLVALGDSYMSGEGAQRFYEGTNKPGGERPNECRRAPTAYARLILDAPESADLATRLGFFACSGAIGRDLWDRPQWAGEPPGGKAATQLQQLAALRDAGAKVSLVMVSVGGNDASFADIGIACIAPGNCLSRGARWLDQLQDVAERLDTTYTQIRNVVSDDVPVLVVPYPQPINADRTGCGYSLLERQEHKFLEGFVRQLNSVVRKAAVEHGFYYLKDMEQALASARMRICDNGSNEDTLGVNFIAISDTEGLIDQLANPFGWLHNSLHPNERGHRQMTQVLASWMESHPAPQGLSDEAGSEVYDVATLQNIMGTSFSGSSCGQPGFETERCALSDLDWTVTEVSRFLRGILAPAFVMVLGAWLVALALLTAARPLTVRASGWLSWRLFALLRRIPFW